MKRMSGRILMVWTEETSTVLTQNEPAGTTVLHVDDVSVFNDDEERDPAGNLGYLRSGSQVVGYTAVDDDAGTVTLASPLDDEAEQDDDVTVWDDLYDEPDTQQYAYVDPDGRGDKADPVKAEVLDAVELADGDRGRRGENCVLERERGSATWTLIAAGGRPHKARGRRWEDSDPYTLTAADVAVGAYTHVLRHQRVVENSLQLSRFGLVEDANSFTVDLDEGIVSGTLEGHERAGDSIGTHYQWIAGPSEERVVPIEAYSAGLDNPIAIPAGVQAGDQVVVLIMSPQSVAATATLNGYEVIDESGTVNGGGSWNYRLAVLAVVATDDSPSVPVLAAHTANALWVACVIRGYGGIVDSELDSQEGGTAADAPAAVGVRNVRVWATCDSFQPANPNPVITPSAGAVIAEENDNVMVNIVAVSGAGLAPVAATNARDVGWAMASLTFGSA